MRCCLRLLMTLYGCIVVLNASPPSVNQSASSESAQTKPPEEDDTSIDAPYANLLLVDKVTGRIQSVDVKVGKTLSIGHLKINVAVCRKSPPFAPAESMSLMTIWEHPLDALPKKLFSGWMLASSPVLSTLENHPRYGAWLLKCNSEKTPTNANPINKKESIVHK